MNSSTSIVGAAAEMFGDLIVPKQQCATCCLLLAFGCLQHCHLHAASTKGELQEEAGGSHVVYRELDKVSRKACRISFI